MTFAVLAVEFPGLTEIYIWLRCRLSDQRQLWNSNQLSVDF